MDNMLSRRQVLAGAASLVVPARAFAASKAPVLVELFTSQGCSSCPPADELAGELMKRNDVIVVSLNVDYWDYLGWKDTLAKPEFTKRQRDYARARGDGDVYTPQMVINGEAPAVGSRKSQVTNVIAESPGSAGTVGLAVHMMKDEVRIDASAAPALAEATLWLMSVAPKVTVDIGRGENAGTQVTYHNVVRSITPMGMYHGAAAQFSMPRQAVVSKDAAFCLAIMQRDMVGQVVGLAKIAI
jgi:hypothetical protein